LSSSFILLSTPLIAIFLLFFKNFINEKNELKIALSLTLLNLFHILMKILLFDSNVSNFQYQFNILGFLIGGLDGISIWLIFLVNLIIPIVL